MVEVLLAIALFSLLVLFLVGSLAFNSTNDGTVSRRAKALTLAEGGLEAVRGIRDGDFANVTVGTFGLATTSTGFIFSGSSDTTDIFTRAITVTSLDSYTKEVSVEVTWNEQFGREGTITLASRLTDWRRQPIALIGDWANPSVEANIDVSGGQNGLKIQVLGDYAYMIRSGGDPDFLVIDVSDTDNPSIAGSMNMSATPQNLAVSGDYAYIASNQNSTELQVVDVSTPASPSQVGSFNASGGADARGLYVNGNTLYMVRSSSGDDEFIVIDITTPTAPSLLGSVDLGDTAREVAVLGNYAYVASEANANELQVVDVSTPASPSIIGSLGLSGGADGQTIAGVGTSTVVLGRSDGRIHILSGDTPSSPVELSVYSATSSINDLSIGNNGAYVFAATDANDGELLILDISTLTSPTFVGSYETNTGDLNGVAYDTTLDRVFAAGENNSEEFIIFEPQ